MTSIIETRAAWGTTVLRIVVGVVFAAHGAQKLFVMGPDALAGFFGSLGIPWPALNAYTVIAIELIGGILVISGLATRIIAGLFAAVVAVAFATVHGSQGFFLPNGYEFVLVLFAASVALVLQGGGAYALDNVVSRQKATGRTLVEAQA